LPTHQEPNITLVSKKIGQNVASLIEDGSTLQMGIGEIPNAVLNELENHIDLGIHTEMFSVITRQDNLFRNQYFYMIRMAC
jgi:acyl-CoA hydrolase